jgi:hypothetical protein
MEESIEKLKVWEADPSNAAMKVKYEAALAVQLEHAQREKFTEAQKKKKQQSAKKVRPMRKKTRKRSVGERWAAATRGTSSIADYFHPVPPRKRTRSESDCTPLVCNAVFQSCLHSNYQRPLQASKSKEMPPPPPVDLVTMTSSAASSEEDNTDYDSSGLPHLPASSAKRGRSKQGSPHKKRRQDSSSSERREPRRKGRDEELFVSLLEACNQ